MFVELEQPVDCGTDLRLVVRRHSSGGGRGIAEMAEVVPLCGGVPRATKARAVRSAKGKRRSYIRSDQQMVSSNSA
jgi:hypothetical protein